MLRTHTTQQLSLNDVDKIVVLCGWMLARRDHGKLIFIDIRDRWGIAQVVFNPKDNPEAYKIAQDLKPEYVILVEGRVTKRPAGTENPKLATGQIEILSTRLEILNPSLTPVFEIQDNVTVTEELKLAYRYLDLRRPLMLNNIVLRHKVIKAMRDLLDSLGFLEVETPILTKSTPEGARDYLVPSRLNPGKFFALPQSPQLFKQLLMVAGLERYFQIAKCFRDEDLRADRQPEFTQLDIELSFVSEEDIFSLSEKIIQEVFKVSLGINLQIPFERLTYQEAISKYKTDKPDLRTKDIEFAFCWVTDFPLFKYNEQEKRLESEHHPFTAMNDQDLHLLDKEPLNARSRSYDLVLNGTEIASGSIRIHNQELQKKIFKIIGINEAEAKMRFGFLLEAFKFGAPPHGGIAFGLDRLIAIMVGTDTIRDVIAFPKTQSAFCPLTCAPSEVDDKQLKELGINTVKRKSAKRKK